MTVTSLLVDVPELGRLNRQQVAALWAWPRSIVIVASSMVDVRSGVVERRSAACSTWRP